jgi:hypothetical protein
MDIKTRKKIEFLQKYVRRKYKKWLNIHSSNIVGFRVDKKIANGKPGRYYSIIFHVRKKLPENKLGDQTIPPFLSVKFPDGKTRKIRTDVEQTGTPQLHLGECRKPRKNGNFEVGTAGIILKDTASFFALTNFHVAGVDLMQQGQFDFAGADNNISVGGVQATFVEGIFSDEIDVAYIRLSAEPADPNILGDGIRIGGFMDGPLGAILIDKDIKVYSNNMRNGKKAKIKSNSVVFHTGFKDLMLNDVLQIRPRITQRGDSGGVVLIDGDVIVGIIVGADDSSTYAIPFFKANNFKPLTIA